MLGRVAYFLNAQHLFLEVSVWCVWLCSVSDSRSLPGAQRQQACRARLRGAPAPLGAGLHSGGARAGRSLAVFSSLRPSGHILSPAGKGMCVYEFGKILA